MSVLTRCAEVGERFGRLTVRSIERVAGRIIAVCDCDCGTTGRPVQVARLSARVTQSCGCWNRDKMRTHGLTGNPVFHRWEAMMARCYNASHPSFANYGGRGVSVCNRWHDPAKFVADMAPGFLPELQLDRIDTGCGYTPSNCRWVSQADNLDNTRRSHAIEHKGRAQTIRRWALELGIPRELLAKRILERGWPIERALATPVLSRTESAKIANAVSQTARSRG